MKRILLTFFILAGLVPIYAVLGWIYIFNKYPNLDHLDKQYIYNSELFFGIKASNIGIILMIILLGFGSLLYFIFKLISVQKEKNKRVFIFTIYLIFTIIVGLFTLLNVWSIL